MAAQEMTFRDPSRRERLDSLGKKVSKLERFVRGYEEIEDPSLSTDDEILNWVFSEAPADFSSGIWLLSSAFYKASASCVRNAYDIAVASLYFQIRENTKPGSGDFNSFFSEWDKGKRQTPNWGEMKPFIAAQSPFQRFHAKEGVDPMEQAYEQFKYLCGLTHTAAFSMRGDPVTVINTTGTWPVFDETFFARGVDIVEYTISMTAILWKVAFPQIAVSSECTELFSGKLGGVALCHS